MLEPDPEDSTLLYFAHLIAGCLLAGLAQLLWDGKKIGKARALGAVLMSGFAGLIVGAMLYSHLKDDLHLLTGVSLLAGIGGASTIDLLTTLLARRMGIEKEEEEEKNDTEQ